MPSQAAVRFDEAMRRARLLRATALESRLRPLSESSKQLYLHASLAASVAGWEAYVEGLVREFFSITANPLLPEYHAKHSMLEQIATERVKKFNTPNAYNARALLVELTGYDPFNDWTWPRRKMHALATRERLDQILAVRHSFAHGFPVPSHPWTQHPTGKIRLTASAQKDNEAFLFNLVQRTDDGMKLHISTTYSKTAW